MTYAEIVLELIRAAMVPGPIVCGPGIRYHHDRERVNVVIALIWLEGEIAHE